MRPPKALRQNTMASSIDSPTTYNMKFITANAIHGDISYFEEQPVLESPEMF